MAADSSLVTQELSALQDAALSGVPRVVKLLDVVQDSADHLYFVLEYVCVHTLYGSQTCQTGCACLHYSLCKLCRLIEGFTLEVCSTVDQISENKMLTLATQLFEVPPAWSGPTGLLPWSQVKRELIVCAGMQTLQCLHEDAGYAHLDLTSVNVMWNPVADNIWDSLRVLDFGSSLKCVSGTFALPCLGFAPICGVFMTMCLTLCSSLRQTERVAACQVPSQTSLPH